MPFIGIDLGTTNSCVASVQGAKPEVIVNEEGHRTTPSCVAFADERRLVGDAAKQQMMRNPCNSIYDAKRLIGRSFDESCVKVDRTRWPFEVVDVDGKPQITVQHKKRQKTFRPEQISAMLLEQMKYCAEEFLGEGVIGAVITVPAYFNDTQRRATRDAASIAKLHVLSLINEPTAAAIAYGLEKDPDVKRNVLIFDLGGGTFDVTVLTIHKGEFVVKATDGNTHLGGEDFSDRLFNHLASEIARKYGQDVKNIPRVASRLRDASEKAKKILSSTTRANINLDGLVKGEDFDTHMTRVRFEQLNEDLFRCTMETVEKALEDANMKKSEIHEVVLVGGSTRIPAIQKKLADFFGASKICKTINPDEAVAIGAAAYAASFSGKESKKERFVLRDVTPLSLGIETVGKVMTVVVKRNTEIPTKKQHNFTTSQENQKVVNFRVFEGERADVKQNHLLGNFLLEGIPDAPAGRPTLKACFEIDKDGVLEVTAIEESKGITSNVTITQEGRERNQEEIKKMVDESDIFRQDDQKWRKHARLSNDLEAAASKAKKALIDRPIKKGKESERRLAIEKCDEALRLIADEKNITIDDLSRKLKEMRTLFNEE